MNCSNRRHGRSLSGGALLVAVLLLSSDCLWGQTHELEPKVEVEEQLYEYKDANNGAGPLWCHGSTCLVGGPFGLVASGVEVIDGAKPLNNIRWTLFRRGESGWNRIAVDEQERTREPSPLVTFQDGRVFLSVNPTLTEPDAYDGPARPEILQLGIGTDSLKLDRILPEWDGTPKFTEHSYRSFAADGPRGELILFQNVGYAHCEWSFRNASGTWSAAGQLKWPWGADYEKPQPIRVCYPNVMLKNRAVHFCGVSDIVEPNSKWREYKRELTGREWDYDFRRLFYTWSDDIESGEFHEWVEIASRESTCGGVQPCDLWIGDDDRVHILWTEKAIDERLRDKFFPDAKQSHALNYAILEAGKIVHQRSLVLAEEGGKRETVQSACFQVAESGRLCVFYYVNGSTDDGRHLSENRIMELYPDGTSSESVVVPLDKPFSQFFSATVRGGSPRSHTIDLLGQRVGSGKTISYARVRLW